MKLNASRNAQFAENLAPAAVEERAVETPVNNDADIDSLKKMATISYYGDLHVYRKETKGHYVYCYCNAIQDRIDGTYECTFKQQENELKKQIENGKIHKCRFKKRTELQKTKQLSVYFTLVNANEDKNAPGTITYDDILTKVAVVVGRENLSLQGAFNCNSN